MNYRHENEFNLCLATDRNMTAEKAATLKTSFENMLKLLEKENLTVKNFRQKFKNTHKIIFHSVPMRHHEDAEFPDLLNNGDFNYMTSSILYSLALKKLNIPTYLMFALNKSTLLVYPGDRQVILETENREDQNGDFNTADKKGMIMNMLDKKVKPGSDYQLSPLQGNQVIRVNELEVLKNTQLPALIYYYKAIARYNAGKEDEAYRLISKACYLCPEDPYVTIMYTMLTNTMQKCEFKHVEDVDLLGQLSRFEVDNFNYIHKTFQSLVTARLVEKNDMEFGKAAYNRLLPQIKDVLLADEISYFYYMCSAYYKNTYRHNTRPALEALKLKPLDKSALQAIEMGLQYKLDSLNDPKSYLDTLNHYEKVLDKTEASGLLKKFRLLTYLDLAKHCFLSNQPQEGENYLTLFESDFQLPVPDISFKIKIENTYYEYARYYVRFNHRAMAQKIVDRGLKYIPNSNMIQTATYVLPRQKPNIIKRKMTKTEYENYMKKN
ncbi:MAG: hypothetical protein Q8903_11240 [Bacteroidota bacterium]|nr:hypothetical protein [Bacteroidota bacterium]